MTVGEPVHLATGNAAKARELAELLGLGERLRLPPAGFVHPDETGATYAENAILKARALALFVGGATIADDSGLEVEALQGRPGLHSARYAGDDRRRIARLLAELEGKAEAERRARFRCVLALVRSDGSVEITEGDCAGWIAFAPRGSGGFGYDPVFVVAAVGKTFAELSPAEKARFGHRGQAARLLRQKF